MTAPLVRRVRAPLFVALLSLPSLALASDTTRVDSVKTRTGFVSNHVVVISIDGLRPDAIAKFNPRTIQRLMKGGSFTLEAKTISLSKTLPSHTSMLTGLDLEQHGVTWNEDRTNGHAD